MIRNFLSLLVLVIVWNQSYLAIGQEAESSDTPKVQKKTPDIKKLIQRSGAWNKSHEDRVKAIESLVEIMSDRSDKELSEAAMAGLMRTRLAVHNDYDDQIIAELLRSQKKAALEHFQEYDKSEDKIKRRFAIEIIACLGCDCPDSILNNLKKKLQSKSVADQWNALYCIKFLGEKALSLEDNILAHLSSEDPQMLYVTLRAAGSLGPKTKKAFEKIYKLTDDNTPITVRTIAFIQMAKVAKGISKREETAAKTLLKKLDSRYFMVNQRALEGLAVLGPVAAEGKETFKKLMTTSKNGLAPYAAYCYAVSTKDYAEANNAIIGRVKDYTDQGQCLIFIEKLGKNAVDLLPVIYTITKNKPEEVSELHIMALHTLAKHLGEQKDLNEGQKKLLTDIHKFMKVVAEDDVDIVSHLCRRLLKDKKKDS